MHSEQLPLSKRPKLVAIVSETTSIDGFLVHFKGETYLDSGNFLKKSALGDRWFGFWTGVFSSSTWARLKAYSSGHYQAANVDGDVKGEGRLLGGLLVMGPDSLPGIYFQYEESSWGDHPDKTVLKESVLALQSEMGADMSTVPVPAAAAAVEPAAAGEGAGAAAAAVVVAADAAPEETIVVAEVAAPVAATEEVIAEEATASAEPAAAATEEEKPAGDCRK